MAKVLFKILMDFINLIAKSTCRSLKMNCNSFYVFKLLGEISFHRTPNRQRIISINSKQFHVCLKYRFKRGNKISSIETVIFLINNNFCSLFKNKDEHENIIQPLQDTFHFFALSLIVEHKYCAI